MDVDTSILADSHPKNNKAPTNKFTNSVQKINI